MYARSLKKLAHAFNLVLAGFLSGVRAVCVPLFPIQAELDSGTLPLREFSTKRQQQALYIDFMVGIDDLPVQERSLA